MKDQGAISSNKLKLIIKYKLSKWNEKDEGPLLVNSQFWVALKSHSAQKNVTCTSGLCSHERLDFNAPVVSTYSLYTAKQQNN